MTTTGTIINRPELKELADYLISHIRELDKNPPEIIKDEIIVNLVETCFKQEVHNFYFRKIKELTHRVIYKHFARRQHKIVEDVVCKILNDKKILDQIEKAVKIDLMGRLE